MSGENLLIHSFKSLSPKQRAFAWTLMDEGGVISRACKKAGVGESTYYKFWRMNPVFVQYEQFVTDLCTNSLELLAFDALKKGLEKGDIKAVRTFYELKGKLKSHQTKIDNNQIKYEIKFGKNPETRIAESVREEDSLMD